MVHVQQAASIADDAAVHQRHDASKVPILTSHAMFMRYNIEPGASVFPLSGIERVHE